MLIFFWTLLNEPFGPVLPDTDAISAPAIVEVETLVPQLFVGETSGVAGVTTTTYNQVGMTYNEGTQIYGGADTIVDVGPRFIDILPFT